MRINQPTHQPLKFQQYISNHPQSKTIQPAQPLQNNCYSQYSENIHNQTINYKLNHSNTSKSKSKISQNLCTYDRKHYYYSEIQRVLTKENHNLKQHNQFLIVEIKNLYEKEKKMKKMLKKYESNMQNLQNINLNLTNQLNLIVSIIMQEIQRIQNLINKQSLKHSRVDSRLINQHLIKNSSELTIKSNKFNQVQHKEAENISTSFFAYSEPSIDHQGVSKSFQDQGQHYISNKLSEIKQKINFFVNNPTGKDINLYAQSKKQLVNIPKQTQKTLNLRIPSRYQILSTNTNSQYVYQLPMQLMNAKQLQRFPFQN